MDDFVSKPFQPERLFQVLDQRIGARAQWQEPPAADGLPGADAEAPSSAPASSVAPPPEVAPIDLSSLAKSVGNDAEKLRRFAALYVRSTEDALAQADELAAAGDVPQLSEIGHRIKSASRAVGAQVLADRCWRLEQAKDSGDADEARRLLAEVRTAFAEVRAAIQQLG
jgi:HPt (histidine-containing phosphotransfer) domain-containing protein